MSATQSSNHDFNQVNIPDAKEGIKTTSIFTFIYQGFRFQPADGCRLDL